MCSTKPAECAVHVEPVVATPRSPIERARTATRAGLAIVVCAVTAIAMPAFGAEHDEGEACAAAGGEPLYSESYWRYDDQGVAASLTLYRCPEGSPFARKHIRARTNAQAPDFDLLDARNRYSEGVRGKGDAREGYIRASANAPERTAALEDHADLVVDAGFDAFVSSHLDASDGPVKSLASVVPSRLGAMKFVVCRVGAETVDHRPAQRLHHSIGSWYGRLLPHIDMVYDDATRHLLRDEGTSSVRDANARNVVVRIVFPPCQRDTQATAADVAAAAAVPLTGTCPLS